MIKDISIIREHLIGYAEVEMPYKFPINCHVKYITFLNNEESFNAGGKFCRKLNDFIILKNNGPSWRVPICMRNKTGEIIYETRFFIPEDTNNIIMKGEDIEVESLESQELKDTIQYQQSIIKKLTERIKEVEVQKYELSETVGQYEELLQQNRFNMKELAIQLREKTNKLEHYEELIPKIYNSR